MIVMIEKSDGSALCHIGDSDHKISVLSGGSAALLRRIAREPGAGAHPVRLFYASGYPGAYVQWPSIIAATHGIAAERAPLPPPTVSQWGHR
jgi:hypothetical protein